jgi:hypothetical protein
VKVEQKHGCEVSIFSEFLYTGTNFICCCFVDILKACLGFWFDGENEQKFTLMRRKKRGTVPIISERVYPDFVEDRSALHEHFCNEIRVNFGHL